jgi:hypothetical protein
MGRRTAGRRFSTATCISFVALFFSLGGVGYAATGGNLILGQSNSATSKTALAANISHPALGITNTSTGTGASALGLTVAAGHAPFSVNSKTKVTNLNADYVDGARIISNRITSTTAGDVILQLPGPFGALTVTSCNHTNLTWEWVGSSSSGGPLAYVTLDDLLNPALNFQGVASGLKEQTPVSRSFTTMQLARNTGSAMSIATITLTANAHDCVFAAQAVVQ